MRTLRFTQWMVFLTLVACFAACSEHPHANLIPRDAALVVSAEPEALIRGAGGEEELRKLADRTENPLFRSLLAAPEETGVDLTEKVYLFASLNRDEPTLLMKLKKASALEQWLKQMHEKGVCGNMQKRGDFTWVFFSGQGYCAFTQDLVVWVYAPLLPPETVLNRLSQLLKQKAEDSFVSTEQYKPFLEIKDPMAFYLSLSTLPHASEISSVLGLPSSASAEELRLVGGLSLNEKKASLVTRFYSENKELNDFLKERGAETHALSGKYFEYIPQDVVACVALRLEKDAYAKIRTLPGVGDVLAGLVQFSGIDAEKFLNSLEGDFTLGLKMPQREGHMIQLMGYAGASGEETRRVLREGLEQNKGFFALPIQTVRPDNYRFSMQDLGAIRFGVQQESFYLMTGEGSPFAVPKESLRKSDFAGMKGKLISYVFANLSEIEGTHGLSREFVGEELPFASQIKAVELMVRPGNRLELNVYFLPL